MSLRVIAFMDNVEGVLLAAYELLQDPSAELLFAKDMDELRSKIAFSGTERELKAVGFRPSADCTTLAHKLLGKRTGRLSPRDPDVEGYISLVLRHSSCDPASLVRFICSCNGSTDLLYSGKTPAGKKYYNYMRDVSRSYHRLSMFARPDLVNGILSVKVDSPHRIGDMFCRWLAGKNPDLPVAVLEKETAWIGNGRYLGLENFTHIRSSFLGSLNFSGAPDDIDDLWDVYYDSQMIPGRRNKGHAKHLQPKASSYISEMSARDRYKVERGISSCTLDNFTG
jgi:hypothetical protein